MSVLSVIAKRLVPRSWEKRNYRRAARLVPRAPRAATYALARWCEWRQHIGALDSNSYYDRLTQLVMARALSADSTCIDVGCHTGVILREMMQLAPQGTFLAFEPLPQLFRELQQHFDDPRVRLFDVALSDQAGSSRFTHVVSNPGYSGLRQRAFDRADETVEEIVVRTAVLDDVLAQERVGKIAFIKIDVEGAEYLVLKGAMGMLRRDRPVIVFEHGLGAADRYGHGPEQLYALLRACGLNISLLSDWIVGRPALSDEQFQRQFHEGMNYYFVAHP
ncbi:MAG TPA: FkbM family methyltransferase [Kofleriaceae bacterium]